MRKLVWVVFAALAMGTMASGCVIDNTYTSCIDSADCDIGDDCFEVSTAETIGNFCSNVCSSDAACESNFGFPGACYAIEADPTSLCYQTCDFDSDCYFTSVCIEVLRTDGLTDFICAPSN